MCYGHLVCRECAKCLAPQGEASRTCTLRLDGATRVCWSRGGNCARRSVPPMSVHGIRRSKEGSHGVERQERATRACVWGSLSTIRTNRAFLGDRIKRRFGVGL